jgi:hypothetical protein
MSLSLRRHDNDAGRNVSRDVDLAGQGDRGAGKGIVDEVQGGVRLVLRLLHHDRYGVFVDDEMLVANSADPEHAAARALMRLGITGTAQTIDARSGRQRLRFDIEVFAQTTVEETSRGGLRIRKWRPNHLYTRSRGMSAQQAFADQPVSQDLPTLLARSASRTPQCVGGA